MEFENDSYIVGKNEEEKAVIVIKYPTEYVRKEKMPISIRVDEIDDTTTGKSLLPNCLTITQQVLYATMCVHLIELI